ncbi:MAG: NADH-quinone oxidoreductase subunit C [Candidatus Paceibacterota bacterium]|jgi:Ni,Fe-hydrogenase III large subunit/Ni,Fe-hydrogenase III component G
MTEELKTKYLAAGFVTNTYGNLTTFEVAPADIIAVAGNLYHEHNLPLKLITALDERKEHGKLKVMYIFGVPSENEFIAPYILTDKEFPSLTPTIHEANAYERKIMSFFGITALGHPDPRPMILHENWPANVHPLRKDFNVTTRPDRTTGHYEFTHIQGEGIYEIPVGPVHAGIIEPGHFRFNVAGEEILNLEGRLGYSHKGSEKLFETLPLAEKIKLSERISGDTSFSHSHAFIRALEKLSDTHVSERTRYLRTIFSELERIACHSGDIGMILMDTGFSFGGMHGARLRESIMRWNEKLSGSRFLRGVNTIGGIQKDVADSLLAELKTFLTGFEKDFNEVIGVAGNSSSVLNRLEGTGILDRTIAKDHGVTGIAGRACGIDRDTRRDFPYAAYPYLQMTVAKANTCDVLARYSIRVQEVRNSITIIREAIEKMPKIVIGSSSTITALPHKKLSEIIFKPNSYVVSIVEGWRGDLVHFVATDSAGHITRVDVRDPSFLNWTAVGYAGRGNMVPDFPLINKSFNLSYTGNDL